VKACMTSALAQRNLWCSWRTASGSSTATLGVQGQAGQSQIRFVKIKIRFVDRWLFDDLPASASLSPGCVGEQGGERLAPRVLDVQGGVQDLRTQIRFVKIFRSDLSTVEIQICRKCSGGYQAVPGVQRDGLHQSQARGVQGPGGRRLLEVSSLEGQQNKNI
jgi:hypothetical protein